MNNFRTSLEGRFITSPLCLPLEHQARLHLHSPAPCSVPRLPTAQPAPPSVLCIAAALPACHAAEQAAQEQLGLGATCHKNRGDAQARGRQRWHAGFAVTWSSGGFHITESKKKSQGCSLKGTSPVLHQGEKSGMVSSGTSAGHRGYGESPQGGYRRPGRAEQCDHSADAKPGDGDVLAWDPSMMDRGFEAWRRNTKGAQKTTIFGRYAGWTLLNAAGSSTVLRAGGRVPSAPRLQCLESLLPLCWGCRHFSQQGCESWEEGSSSRALPAITAQESTQHGHPLRGHLWMEPGK